jgi:REP element-mobilizing transposase RayT
MRKSREIKENGTYHICARINRQEMIFSSSDCEGKRKDYIKDLFLDVMKKAKTKYSFRCKSFCIMGNHVHLIIEITNDESISRLMQWILSVFALKFNRIHKYKGHVWYDQFKSKIVSSFNQFLNTFVYIANNPVRARLVYDPFEYQYSSLRHYHEYDFSIIEAPDDTVMAAYQHYCSHFQYTCAIIPDKTLGFYPEKSGRK